MTASKTRAEFEAWAIALAADAGLVTRCAYTSPRTGLETGYLMCGNCNEYSTPPDNLLKFAEAARRAALEEAAKVLEARIMGDNNREDQEAKRCVAAIRALGDEGMKP